MVQMDNFLVDRFEAYKVVVGDEKASIPDYAAFLNCNKALEVLNKHIMGNKSIVCHADIDVDGIGSAYIIHRFLLSQGAINRCGFIINKEKEHGIKKVHVDYLNNENVGLLVVLDSSTNEIENIKNMNCDVIVIDHHEILHDELMGKTAGGEYVIISNMIDNLCVNEVNEWFSKKLNYTKEYVKEYKKEDRMSGGLVLYELLRLYQLAYNLDDVLDKMMLYQWVGITLLTDVIPLSNYRNQYYIEKTVHNIDTESGLKIMMEQLNAYQKSLDKSFISFTFAPTINRAIRAGKASQALDIILNRQSDIRQLEIYKEAQSKILDNYRGGVNEYDTYVMKDITDTDINKNYCGLLATKICEDTKKNTVVYIVNDGIAMGSFRGRLNSVDYRKFFEQYETGIYAQGHKSAFGFKVRVEILSNILAGLSSIEEGVDNKPYVTAGNIHYNCRGKYHIDDIDNFKRQGLLWKLAIANSKVSNEESVDIVVLNSDIEFIEQTGKVYWYNILGMRCMAFEVLNAYYIGVYLEYSRDIKIYAKNIKNI